MTKGTAAIQGPLWGARARDYGEQEKQGAALYRFAIDKVQIHSGSAVLDIGCGTGVFAELAAAAGASVSGLDAAEGMVEVARERVPDAEFRIGDLQFLPYDDATFDVVTAFNAIQYAADPTVAAAGIKRITRPGGSVFVLVWGRPEHNELVAVVKTLGRFLPPAPEGAPGPFALSYPGALEAVLIAGGLSISDEGYLEVPMEYSDRETLLRANLAPGPAVMAARAAGEETLREALATAFAPFRTASGRYRIETEWRFVHATA
jgi:SAM-dependent methyltransferase